VPASWGATGAAAGHSACSPPSCPASPTRGRGGGGGLGHQRLQQGAQPRGLEAAHHGARRGRPPLPLHLVGEHLGGVRGRCLHRPAGYWDSGYAPPMADVRVFVDDAVLGRLPDVCAKSGAPADGWLTVTETVGRSGGIATPWLLLLLILGPLGWLAL